MTAELKKDMEEGARILADPKAVQYFLGCADGYQAGYLAGVANAKSQEEKAPKVN